MSVINQMLNALDQRNAEQAQSTSTPVMVTKKTSTVNIFFISLIVILTLNGIGLYVWQIVSENQLLKQHAQSQTKVQIAAKQPQKQIIEIKAPAPTILALKNQVQPVDTQLADTQLADTQPVVTSIKQQVSKVSSLVNTKPVNVNPAKTNLVKANPVKTKVASVIKPESKMTISRRHLTEDELVAQKVAKAELALNREKISKAEQLFEDVLIIQPKNVQVRQKLAALWFGRKAYQQASNLLSQGIALETNNSDIRMMKAKIELQQNKYQAAYRTLKPLAKLQQQGYQVLLANTAQQANQMNGAITAYKMLINLQPDSARWSLGLAIVYDKNSQFQLATAHYQQALNKNDLSVSSSSFAQQRIQVLKE